MNLYRTFSLTYLVDFIEKHQLNAGVFDSMLCFSATFEQMTKADASELLRNCTTVHLGVTMGNHWTSRIFNRTTDDQFTVTHFVAYVPNDGVTVSHGHVALTDHSSDQLIDEIYRLYF